MMDDNVKKQPDNQNKQQKEFEFYPSSTPIIDLRTKIASPSRGGSRTRQIFDELRRQTHSATNSPNTSIQFADGSSQPPASLNQTFDSERWFTPRLEKSETITNGLPPKRSLFTPSRIQEITARQLKEARKPYWRCPFPTEKRISEGRSKTEQIIWEALEKDKQMTSTSSSTTIKKQTMKEGAECPIITENGGVGYDEKNNNKLPHYKPKPMKSFFKRREQEPGFKPNVFTVDDDVLMVDSANEDIQLLDGQKGKYSKEVQHLQKDSDDFVSNKDESFVRHLDMVKPLELDGEFPLPGSLFPASRERQQTLDSYIFTFDAPIRRGPKQTQKKQPVTDNGVQTENDKLETAQRVKELEAKLVAQTDSEKEVRKTLVEVQNENTNLQKALKAMQETVDATKKSAQGSIVPAPVTTASFFASSIAPTSTSMASPFSTPVPPVFQPQAATTTATTTSSGPAPASIFSLFSTPSQQPPSFLTSSSTAATTAAAAATTTTAAEAPKSSSTQNTVAPTLPIFNFSTKTSTGAPFSFGVPQPAVTTAATTTSSGAPPAPSIFPSLSAPTLQSFLTSSTASATTPESKSVVASTPAAPAFVFSNASSGAPTPFPFGGSSSLFQPQAATTTTTTTSSGAAPLSIFSSFTAPTQQMPSFLTSSSSTATAGTTPGTTTASGFLSSLKTPFVFTGSNGFGTPADSTTTSSASGANNIFMQPDQNGGGAAAGRFGSSAAPSRRILHPKRRRP